MKDNYFLKKSKVKGRDYFQIWRNGDFIKTAGSPESIYRKLVRLEELEKKTNLLKENLTNLAKGKEVKND